MKMLLLLTTLLLSMNLFAATAMDVCKSQSFSSDKAECMGIINQGYIDNDAADACMAVSFGSDKNDCLRAALNKEYTAEEAAVCKSATFSKDIVQCMRNTGVVAGEDDDIDEMTAEMKLAEIERLATAAKKELRAGHVLKAISLIDRILDLATEKFL